MSYIKSNSVAFSEIELRKNRRKNLLTFGNDFLDDALKGILPNDLILIGAGSGAGKTELSCNIAKANIEKGKRVHFIALEAELYEIERRIKYQLFAKAFFDDISRPDVNIAFDEWMLGDFIESCEKYEAIAAKEFMNNYENQFTYYKQENFTPTDFIEKVLIAHQETDLIILDHVHYFDFDDDNENRAIKEIAKTARSLTLEYGKPIILVSHLRKRDRGTQDMCPGLEEFHGSSDLYKIATKAITIAPGGWDPGGKYETFFRIVKNRFGGSVVRYLASCNYIISEGRYEKGYRLGEANQKRDEEFRDIEGNLHPKWAKHSTRESSFSNSHAKEKPANASIKSWSADLYRGQKSGQQY